MKRLLLPFVLLLGCSSDDPALEEDQAAVTFHPVRDIAVAVQDSSSFWTESGGRAFSVRFRIMNLGAVDASNVALDSVTVSTRTDGGESLGQNGYGHAVLAFLGHGQSTTYVVSCPGSDGFVCTSVALRATNPAGDDYPLNDAASAAP
jgi:hypothetical protein